MLCEVQKGFTGCSQYFPAVKGEIQQHGDINISLEDIEDAGEGILKRRIKIQLGDEIRHVMHMQFTRWPNYGVVEDVSLLTGFVQEVHREAQKGNGEPIVVHCSGGVGRSGTFTTIYSLYSFLVCKDIKRLDSLLRAINWLYVVIMEISMVKTNVGCYGNQILALQPCGGNPYGA